MEGIRNNWSLTDFRANNGKMSINQFYDEKNKEYFTSCVFTKENAEGKKSYTFVAFSKKLGVLTSTEVKARKDELQVVLTKTEAGKDRYVLCTQGMQGEEVDI